MRKKRRHYTVNLFGLRIYSEASIDSVLDGNAYHGMRDLPSETFVTGFFSNELANTVGVPFTHDGSNYALFLRPDIKMLFTEVHYILGWNGTYHGGY